MFSMKSGTPYMIFPFAPPSNTLRDTKTVVTTMIASLSLPNSTWMQIPHQETSNHSMAAIALTFPFYPMLVPNSK
jgi:ABC-type transporter lipoprotein component MlaA